MEKKRLLKKKINLGTCRLLLGCDGKQSTQIINTPRERGWACTRPPQISSGPLVVSFVQMSLDLVSQSKKDSPFSQKEKKKKKVAPDLSPRKEKGDR
jgi:hypothetical protein